MQRDFFVLEKRIFVLLYHARSVECWNNIDRRRKKNSCTHSQNNEDKKYNSFPSNQIAFFLLICSLLPYFLLLYLKKFNKA